MKILLIGACGRMGTCVRESVTPPHKIVCGVDTSPQELAFPVYANISEARGRADVAIDFSSPNGLEERLVFCAKKNLPLVLACTGFSAEDEEKIKYYARHITIFKSENFSLGVALLGYLAKMTAETLKEFDVEIIEKHHSQKKDAPSGTAIALANSVNEALHNKKSLAFGRDGKRERDEIGIHSVRAGTIVGEHEIVFAGEEEIVTLSHSALSRKVFAIGALRAAEWSLNRPAGIYTMNDLWEG